MKKILLVCFIAVTAILNSCSSEYEVLKSVDAVILRTDSSVKLIGEEMTFTATNSDGEDLTSESTFFVNGTEIEGHTFTSEVVGSFTITASYLNVNSEPVVVNFHDGSEVNFAKNLLIEDYTGTWCGYCPRVAHAIELVKNQTTNVVPVAIHRVSSNPDDASYDPYNFDSEVLENLINVPGYPKGLLNRSTLWNFPEPNNVNQAIALTQGENPKLGLAMTSTVSGNNLSLDVNVKFAKDFSGMKLVVYVLENGLIHEQHNYTSFYNGEDLIANYEHNHVLRACLTPLLGEAVADAETKTGKTYKRTFNVPLPTNIANTSKIEFVAFLINANNEAVNVRKSNPGETQAFEEL